MSDPEFPDSATRHVLVPGCARCPALAKTREHVAWGTGPPDAAVVVVGEAPAAGDPDADRWQGGNHTGMAYTSRHSGRRIRALFSDLGYDPYYTNAVKCFPRAAPSGDREQGDRAANRDRGSPADPPTNREPTEEERQRCRVHLRAELDQVAPVAVVPTGAHATRAVFATAGLELDGFLESVLEPVRWEALGSTVVPIVHPSYQDVWVSRLGYDAAGYREAVGDVLDDLV